MDKNLKRKSKKELQTLFIDKFDLPKTKETYVLCERLTEKKIILLIEGHVGSISVSFMCSFPELANNRKCALLMCSFYSENFKYLSEKLRSDEELVKMVLSKNGKMFEHVGKSLKEKDEIIDLAIDADGYAIRYCSESKKTKERVLRAMKTDVLSFAWSNDKEIREDLDILEFAFKTDARRAILYVPTVMRTEIEMHEKDFKLGLKESALWYIGKQRSEKERNLFVSYLDNKTEKSKQIEKDVNVIVGGLNCSDIELEGIKKSGIQSIKVTKTIIKKKGTFL